jgi:hypothetical protein
MSAKVGFTYERDIVHAGLAHVFYRVKQEVGAPERRSP